MNEIRLGLAIGTLAAAATLLGSLQVRGADAPRASKDVGPASAACDGHDKSSAEWKGCIGQAAASMPDRELFYAGYWLAKSGQFKQALSYLELARTKDERVLTYIGFATRKLGHVEAALPIYAKALAINPEYAVARAYLGEAYLSMNEPAKARAELAEIARRCGTSCAPYAELAGEIARFESTASRG